MSTDTSQAIIVLGMHRSGTSALGGVLHFLGARQPQHLMPPTDANPKGYWESVRLMAFHDRLLTKVESSWDDWSPIVTDWFDSGDAEDFRDELPRILEEEFSGSPLILLKDPRMCRIMPLWQSTLSELDIDPAVIITLRSAAETVASLETRDGFDGRRALLLWLRHVLDAEHDTRSMKRTFVRYGSLLSEWRTEVNRVGAELDIRWPRSPEDAGADIDDFLDGSLRHHRRDLTSTSDRDDVLMVWVAEVSAALEALATPGKDKSHALVVLDNIRQEFDRSATIFRDAIRDEVTELRTALSHCRTDLGAAVSANGASRSAFEVASRELEATRADRESIIATLDATIAELHRERESSSTRAARVTDLEAQLFVLRSRTEEGVGELAKLTRRTLDAEAQFQRMRSKLRPENKRLRLRLARTDQRVSALLDEVTAVKASTSWRVTAPLRAISRQARRAGRLVTTTAATRRG